MVSAIEAPSALGRRWEDPQLVGVTKSDASFNESKCCCRSRVNEVESLVSQHLLIQGTGDINT
jgi:hypothetical protein